jgi:2'-5' RNA ligase
MTESVLRSALILAVPEAGRSVEQWRERTCTDKPSIGIPAHVTLLFPFVPASEIDDRLVAELSELFGGFENFNFELRETRRWPEMVYLAPEPPEPFVDLTEAIVARYPDYPPYEGVFDSIVPHLTVAHGGASLLGQAEAELLESLPIGVVAREVVLLEETVPDWGRWQTRARFALKPQA